MRAWKWCAVMLLLGATARAQEAEEYQDLAAFFEASTEFVGDERFGEADVKSFLEHFVAFEELEVAAGGDDGRFFKDGKFRYDLVLADKAYLAWAKARSLDPKAWLRKTVRIMTVHAKGEMEGLVAEVEAMIAETKRLGKEAGEESPRQLDALEAAIKRLGKAFKAIPARTEVEAKLFEKYKKDLDRVTGADEEEEEEEEGCAEEEEGDPGR